MPELPEVESIRRVLKNSLINQKLQKYKIFDQRINRFNTVNPRNLGVLLEIYRKGKILQFNFKNNSIFFHLGMSGRLDLNGIKNKHTHGIFFFDEDVLHYDDIRKFGYIKILKNDLANKQFAILGPDALSLSKLDKIFVMNKAKKSSTSIKKFLLDQKNISGLGNIYVNEILFESGIKPKRKVGKLKDFEITKIVKKTKKILKNSIRFGGSSIKDFSSDNGKKGAFQQHFKVYGKKGEKCSNIDCKEIIIKTVISNRSSFFCNNCQK